MKNKIIRSAVAAVNIVTLITFSSFCQRVTGEDVSPADNVLTVYMDEAKIVPVETPSKIAIGNPAIADVALVTETEIVISPKAAGSTSFSYKDARGDHDYVLRVLQKDLTDMRTRLNNMLVSSNLTNVETAVNENEQKIFLLGYVLNKEERARLDKIVDLVKENVVDFVKFKEEEVPIEIEVAIAEINKSDENNLGVNWWPDDTGTIYSLKEVPIATAAIPGAQAVDAMSVGDRLSQGFRVGHTYREKGFQMQLQLMAQLKKGKILADPRIMCLSGKEANLVVGGEVPIVSLSQSSTSTSSNVEYKKYGITLNIKPNVKTGGKISLGLSVEVSEIDSANSVVVGTVSSTEGGGEEGSSDQTVSTPILAPAFITERAETEVFLNNGETVVLAGLNKDKDEVTRVSFPGFQNIPILNKIFGYEQHTKVQKELIIVLTPRIIDPKAVPGPVEQPPISQDTKDMLQSLPSKLQPTAQNTPSDALVTLSGNAQTLTDYKLSVRDMLAQRLEALALNENQSQCTNAILGLTVNAGGKAKKVLIRQSSGDKKLDATMIKIARKTAYPRFPEGMKDWREIDVDVPVVFQASQPSVVAQPQVVAPAVEQIATAPLEEQPQDMVATQAFDSTAQYEPVPQQAVAPSGDAQALMDYKLAARDAIAQQLMSIDQKKIRQGGQLVLDVVVASSGKIKNISIKQSSGDKKLDKTAVAVAKKTALPAFPYTLQQTQLDFDIPIIFQAG